MPRKAKAKVEKAPPKKRGRKPKKKPENTVPVVPKKRGRKPKGGKILKKNEKISTTETETKPNIVLHFIHLFDTSCSILHNLHLILSTLYLSKLCVVITLS